MTFEQFKIWADMHDQITDYAYDFFDTIRKEYPALLADKPSNCYYDGIEISDHSARLLIKYTISGENRCIFKLSSDNIKQFLASPVFAAREYAKEQLALQEREKTAKLLEQQLTEQEKEIAEFNRIKEKYNL